MSEDAPVPLLDAALMQAYEDQLRTQGVPVNEWKRPGLTGDQADEILAPLGLRLPVEGRAWWGWHDGPTPEGRALLFGPWKYCVSLVKAVEIYREFRGIVEAGVEPDNPPLDDPDYRWNPAWLPIDGPQLPTVIDCSVPEGEPTPLRFIDLADVEESPKPRAQSLGQMVSWWIAALETGAWKWDRQSETWERDRDRLDETIRMSPLL
jgi:cell wall assembly regulator SMI1